MSRYALGRDYHKVLRARLQRLADRIAAEVGEFGYRVFTDSAPVMEVELAARAGLGWRGKHTLALAREAGSFFFLGEIYTDLPLPVDAPVADHCGTCTRCIEACPTRRDRRAVRARRAALHLVPDDRARRARSRSASGRSSATASTAATTASSSARGTSTRRPRAEPDFARRNGLDAATLVELFAWPEARFHARLAGSAIHRIGYERWSRNLAVGLGNAPTAADVVAALRSRAR